MPNSVSVLEAATAFGTWISAAVATDSYIEKLKNKEEEEAEQKLKQEEVCFFGS